MLPLGKLRSDVLNEILERLEINDGKVVIGPREGFDSAVLEYDEEHYLVVATDPVLGVPEEHFGFFTYHFASSDVSVFGTRPRWLVVDILLPEGSRREELAAIMGELNAECAKYGTSVVGGHTGVYRTLRAPTATTTAMGIVRREELRLPVAKPGDEIVITKGVGIEFAVGAAWFDAEGLKKHLSPGEIAQLREMYRLETVVSDALVAAPFVRGMHDATEGGLTALHEIADNSNLGFEVDMGKVYIPPLVDRALGAYGVNPLTVSSTGTLIAIVPPSKAEVLVRALGERGIPAFRIGRFTEDKGRLLKNGEGWEEFPRFEGDAYAGLY
ncbi:AIR synthase family protein [Palaeococcus ferrophilus]|uniref:AIR synthase family protein n=1 Tax=Palaeococcus ferrophilus TaxID=83868 RepID=UPI00064E503A|nr:AIR synthase family protein [Palaeococcus ferrophilus]